MKSQNVERIGLYRKKVILDSTLMLEICRSLKWEFKRGNVAAAAVVVESLGGGVVYFWDQPTNSLFPPFFPCGQRSVPPTFPFLFLSERYKFKSPFSFHWSISFRSQLGPLNPRYTMYYWSKHFREIRFPSNVRIHRSFELKVQKICVDRLLMHGKTLVAIHQKKMFEVI